MSTYAERLAMILPNRLLTITAKDVEDWAVNTLRLGSTKKVCSAFQQIHILVNIHGFCHID